MKDEERSLTQRTLTGLLWAGSEACSRVLLQLGVSIVLARLLTPSDFGVLGVALLVVGFSQCLSQLGIGPALVQRAVLTVRHLKTGWSLSVLLSLLFAGIIFSIAPSLSQFLRMPELTHPLRILSLIFPIAGLGSVSESLLQRELKFRTLARIEVSSYFLGSGCVSVALALLHFGLWALVAGQLVQISLRSLQMLLAAKRPPQFGFEWDAFRDLWLFSGSQTVVSLASYVATNGDNFIVGKFLGAEQMGIYNRAWQFLLAPLMLVGCVMEKVLFPALSKVQNQPELLKHAYRQSNQLLAVLILPLAAVIYLLAPDAIPLVLGEKWQEVAFPLQLFSIGLLWRTGMKINNSFIRSYGAVKLCALCQVGYAISLVIAAWIGSWWNIPGVCLAVLVPVFGCYASGVVICLNVTRLTLADFCLDHVPGMLLCALVGVGGWLCAELLHARAVPAFVTIGVVASVMGTITILSLFIWPEYLLGEYGKSLKETAFSSLTQLTHPTKEVPPAMNENRI
jgi:O-antigen/teichoic acid export membrane protein